MNSTIYKIRGLLKYYGNHRVLEIPELDIQQGEIFAVIGPSGSGKSTLLRMLNFLEPPTSGSIYFHDNEFNPNREMPLEVRRRVTTVFQQPILLNQSVWSNVIYGLELRGQRDSIANARSVLEQVGLSHLANQRARTLSGGEAQRVALARALILNPEALLLDEPTANLDPYNIKIIEEIVKKTNIERGTTLVLVTHNVFQAKRLANRVALILEGKLVEVSDTERFFNAPADERTAAFVRGDMVY